jgi:small-conductance mechanosensitive channel
MDVLSRFYETLILFVPAAVVIVVSIIIIWLIRVALLKPSAGFSSGGFRRQLITLLLSIVGLVALILVLPIESQKQDKIINLLGILLTAAIALSSTTFLGNIMAGLMLRVVRNFRPGDFIKVGENFGRVSERGLFHVEIQTESRDLITLPNLYLVTHPVEVTRPSGTVIAAEISLGYDTPHRLIENLLKDAAIEAGLTEPFVHIINLGDFSISYRVAGLLIDTKKLLSARSELRRQILDKLHGHEVEIVSPTFMNTRAQPMDKKFIPAEKFIPGKVEEPAEQPEKIVFDKADEAESIENLKKRHEEVSKELEQLKKQPPESDDDQALERHKARLEGMESRLRRIAELINSKEEKQREDED